MGCCAEIMVSQPDVPPPTNPPPVPTPRASDAAQGAAKLEEDLRKKRRSVASSFLAGETGASSTSAGAPAPAGNPYLG